MIIIASYNGGNGYDYMKSLYLLNKHFKYNILFQKQADSSIREAVTTYSIFAFTTRKKSRVILVKVNY